MTSICLNCGRDRDDNRDSFCCPTCHGDMNMPDGWPEIIYWMIYLDDDGVFLTREFVVDDTGALQPVSTWEADSLDDARGRLPGNVHRVVQQFPPHLTPGTLIEVWRPVKASTDDAGTHRDSDHVGPVVDPQLATDPRHVGLDGQG